MSVSVMASSCFPLCRVWCVCVCVHTGEHAYILVYAEARSRLQFPPYFLRQGLSWDRELTSLGMLAGR